MTDLIAKHGGYENLKSFQMAEIAYDLNFQFCERYIKSHKMRDQMEGAGRGGHANIGEGSRTSGTSKQSELRLMNVARASLDELRLDFQDYLRQRELAIWDKKDPRILEIRNLAYVRDRTYKTYMTYLSDAESGANCVLCVIHQANYLLDGQMKALEKELVEKGDYKERYREARKEKIIGEDSEGYDDLLKQNKMKRLPNGRIVSEDSTDIK